MNPEKGGKRKEKNKIKYIRRLAIADRLLDEEDGLGACLTIHHNQRR